MPSLRTCCHSAVCCSASWASSLRRSRSSVSRRASSGSLSAASSEFTDRLRCSAAERISATTWSRTRSFSRDSTFSERKVTIAGKFDSSLSSLSLSSMAWLRSSDDAGISGSARPARCRCAVLAATIWRQNGYRSVLVATIAPTGQISWAWRMNRISGSVNSWLVSLIISIASASGSNPRVDDRCGWPCPPTPGVSMNVRPPLSSGLGAPTSTRSTSPALRLRGTAQIVADVVDRDVDLLRRHTLTHRDDQPGRRLLGVADHGDQRGGLVVTDAGHRHVEQRVEQLALALLELTGDHHPDLRVGDALLGDGQPRHQVATVVEVGDRAGVIDQLDDHFDPARVLRLRHMPSQYSRLHRMRTKRRGPPDILEIPAVAGLLRNPAGDCQTPAPGRGWRRGGC